MESALWGNMEAWMKKYEMSTPDEKSLAFKEIARGKVLGLIGETSQSGMEVAEIVKTIILSKKPNLRYQINDKFNLEEVKAKLTDPPGNVLVEMLKKSYFG